ncbi:hypothetical protein K435DRAFT_802871 [Dendrothele bispora CBS 962.96]|uniref:DUF6534 domain-containing protein n=1 Tax=Dendrothele bispora (strain CBS 962.96) TaxID=1314807 RepID=A0A4V4HE14_DENBC|nr:hypothetical protein K435DRAFT_802871 [Dendrothele bispora CBS 962.96]
MSEISLILGGVIVSTFVGFLALGIVLSCAWNYFVRFRHDKLYFKAIVSVCALLCIGETIFLAHWGYSWGVTHYGGSSFLLYYNVNNDIYFSSELNVIAMAPGSITFIVQWFYAWRLWIISLRRNVWFPSLVALLATVTYCLPVLLGLSVAQFLSITDILISSGLFYYLDIKLRRKQIKTYLKRLRVIILRTVECNVLSLIAQVGMTILFICNVGFYYLILVTAIGKVHTFSLIVSLNARSNGSSVSRHGNPNDGLITESESLPLSVILQEARPESNPATRSVFS